MLLGVVLLPVMNAIAKSLAADYLLTQVVWARFLGHLVWMSLFLDHFSVPRCCAPIVPAK